MIRSRNNRIYTIIAAVAGIQLFFILLEINTILSSAAAAQRIYLLFGSTAFAVIISLWLLFLLTNLHHKKKTLTIPIQFILKSSVIVVFGITFIVPLISHLMQGVVNIRIPVDSLLNNIIALLESFHIVIISSMSAIILIAYYYITPKAQRSLNLLYLAAANIILLITGMVLDEYCINLTQIYNVSYKALGITVSSILLLYYLLYTINQFLIDREALLKRIHEGQESANLKGVITGLAEEYGSTLKIITAAVKVMQQHNALIPKALQAINRSTTRGKMFTQALHHLISGEHGYTMVNVPGVVKEIYLLVMHELRRKNIELTVAIPKNMEIYTVRHYLQQIIYNLILNGINAISGVGTLRLTVTLNKSTIILIVSDTGEGIQSHVVKRILDPLSIKQGLFLTGAAKVHAQGLSAVQVIVQRMNGMITVTSSKAAGTSVAVTLPRLQAH